MNNSSSRPKPQYITTSEALRETCDQILVGDRFAFDTEFVMEDRYEAEVCVLQLATESVVAVVDALQVQDLSPVWSLVANPNLEVIVHAGTEDLFICHAQGGLVPTRVFDCQVAHGLVSCDYPLSLLKMLRDLLGIRVHKTQTLTDWRRRPLAPEQISYAANDVVHLLEAHRILSGRLRKSGRAGWMEEEMERFSQPDTYNRDLSENILKLKGSGALDGQGLAIAQELVKARDDLAARYNRPVRAVVRDHLMIEIARHRWTKESQIKTLRGLNLRAEGIRLLATAVKRGLAIPESQWPVPSPPDRETDQEAALSLLARAVIRSGCAEQGIAPQLVASKNDTRSFVRSVIEGTGSASAGPLGTGWRTTVFGGTIRDIISGKSSVRVTGKKDDLKVVVK